MALQWKETQHTFLHIVSVTIDNIGFRSPI